MAGEASSVVVDIGALNIRLGIAGEETPQFEIPSAIGCRRFRENGISVSENAPSPFPANKGVDQGDLLFDDKLNELIENGRVSLAKTSVEGGLSDHAKDSSTECVGEDYTVRRLLRMGAIEGFDELNSVLLFGLKRKLRLAPEEHPLLLAEPPLNQKLNRELLSQMLFEKFGVPALYMGISSALAMYGSGRTTALVVESGESCSYTVPVVEGTIIHHATHRFDVGGQDITATLLDSMRAQPSSNHVSSVYDNLLSRTSSTSWRQFVTANRPLVNSVEEERMLMFGRRAKEAVCFVADDFAATNERWASRDIGDVRMAPSSAAENDDLKGGETEEFVSVSLPDGTKINLGKERFHAVEALFDPSIVLGRSTTLSGIHHSVYHSVFQCDPDIRKELLSNIVTTGGNVATAGFDTRLLSAVESIMPSPQFKVKIQSAHASLKSSNKTYSAWLGGSILGSLSVFQQLWITKDEYDESGPPVAHRKCF